MNNGISASCYFKYYSKSKFIACKSGAFTMSGFFKQLASWKNVRMRLIHEQSHHIMYKQNDDHYLT